ncbi:MAG: Fic family protein [Nanoarchaeota archaeon]
MTPLTTKEVKGKKYLYLERSIRLQNQSRKISKYLGPAESTSKQKITAARRELEAEFFAREVRLRTKTILETVPELGYPLTAEEVEKIEEMNLKYKRIRRTLHKKNIEDLTKRFIANYVFESNALEGNSLTLKNVAEIVFENRISSGKDLREIYDAQNSYNLFLWLQRTRQELSSDFIIQIHRRLMEKIDDRLGYRKVPIILLGKPLAKLSSPEKVTVDMERLLSWYQVNKEKIYPLELAFKFHAQFEKIHPFCDGNGRVGRFLLNYILLRKGYFPIIIRKTSRQSYLKALEAADREIWIVLLRFALKHYKDTFRKFFEVYYRYAQAG